MSAYLNSVSDKLFVFSYPEKLNLCIASKEGKPKWLEHNHSTLPASLGDSVFASQYLIHVNCAFTLCPTGLSAQEQRLHFELSHAKRKSISTITLLDDIDLIFAPDKTEGDLNQLIRPEQLTDISMLHEYKSGMSRSNAIYFSVSGEWMLIRTYSGPRLILANRFPIENKDDIFYFVMYAIEQIKLDVNGIHFEFQGTSEDFKVYESMFQNYLPKLHHLSHNLIDSSLLSDEHKEALEKDWLTTIALQCV
jgi:hypothetical protein